MAVTTSNTIKLSDVCLEIYGSSNTSGKSLVGLHAAATGTFDPAYAVAGADTLLDFRGYSHGVSYTLFYRTSLSYSTLVSACGNSPTVAVYHNGANSLPVVNDIVYSDSGGTSPLAGGSQWYIMGTSSGGNPPSVMQVDNSGVVISVGSCI